MEAHYSVISIKEARKLLGSQSRSMGDDQIREMIRTLQQIADDLLDVSLERPLGA